MEERNIHDEATVRQKPKLEIVVPHYREPWETGRKLFEMLELQRGIKPGDFRVLLVQDGPEGAVPDICLEGWSYEVRLIVMNEHSGVSRARNAGIDEAEADWICFCDFDDMHTSAFSLMVALEAIRRAEEHGQVYLWNRFSEEGEQDGKYVLYRHDWDMVFIHGRFYNRRFLLDNDIRFNPELDFGEDQDFNTVCQIVAGHERIGEIRDPIYLWCTNEQSVTRREKDKSVFYPKMLKHRFTTLEEVRRRGIGDEYTAGVVRTVMNSYYEMTAENAPEAIRGSEEYFAKWWKEHRGDYLAAPKELKSEILSTVRRNAEEHRGVLIERITVGQWLNYLDQKYWSRNN